MNRAATAAVAVLAVLAGAGPADAATGDIPADLLPIYQQAAHDTCGMPWEVLAAVGRVESNHGRSTAPGVRSGTNSAGAMGPMQFLRGTWAGYKVDGDRDGDMDVYDPTDAIWGAARLLCANGAGEGDDKRLRSAIWNYNHADWYVDKVLTVAAEYQLVGGGSGGLAALAAAPMGLIGAIPGPGDIAEGIGDAMVDGFAKAAASGAEWVVSTVATIVDRSSKPDVQADWFSAPLASMRDVAATLAVPILIAGVMQSLLRRDPNEMVRRAVLFPALAGLAMVAFLGITAMLLGVVDWMNARMMGIGGGPGRALEQMATWFAESRPIPELATIAISVIAILAAGIIWLELLFRNAALYVALLFFPLGLATLMWPAASGMARRLASFIGALILFPFVIVAVLVLASAAMAGTAGLDPTPEKTGVVMTGIASLGLAAIAPYKLLGWAAMAGAAAAAGGGTGMVRRYAPGHRSHHIAHSRSHDSGPSDNGYTVMGASAGAPGRVVTANSRVVSQSAPHRSWAEPTGAPPVSSTEVVRSGVVHSGPQRGGVVLHGEPAPAAPVAVVERTEGK